MKRLEVAVVGAGAAMLTNHWPALMDLDVAVVAVVDVDQATASRVAADRGIAVFGNTEEMLNVMRPELTVVTSPPNTHAAVTLSALDAGSHVFVEKPMATRVADADLMNRRAAERHRLLGVNYQYRCRTEVRALRELVASKTLGRIDSIEIWASWPRTGAYYADSRWRGTWRGEGGGVTMNQGIHHLDLLCYLFGMPRAVRAIARTLCHPIETEDTLDCLMSWDDGAVAHTHFTTAAGVRGERVVVHGSAGRAVMSLGGLRVETLDTDMTSFATTAKDPFASPNVMVTKVPIEEHGTAYQSMYANLLDAIRNRDELICDGSRGRDSLELANACLLAATTNRDVSLPLDVAFYNRWLDVQAGPDSPAAVGKAQ